MVNQLITTPTVPTEPGIYAKITAVGVPAPTSTGIVAIVAKASSGPLGQAVLSASPTIVKQTYGPASAVDRTSLVSQMYNLAREAWISGAIQFVTVRPGSGGTAASSAIKDGVNATVGNLAHPYPGVYGNGLTYTIRAVAGDSTRKEVVVYDSGVAVQTNRFPAASGDEAGGLATATVGQPYAVFTKTSTGNGVLATATGVSLGGTTPGVDPTVSAGDYTTAFGLLSGQNWATLVTDSESSSVHTALSQFLDTEVQAGRFRTGCVGEPSTVAEATRRSDATALNSSLVRYEGGWFTYPNGDGTTRTVEGFLAAAHDAGVVSSLTPGDSMTWRSIPGALGVGGCTDKSAAILAGMGYYETSTQGYRTGAGISTLVTPSTPPIWAIALHSGWKKLEHVATAFGLLTEIGTAWDELVAAPDPADRPGNTDAGRAAIAAVGNRVTKKYRDRGWLQSGTVIVDQGHPATSDTAFFTFDQLLIALRAERLVLELPFGQP